MKEAYTPFTLINRSKLTNQQKKALLKPAFLSLDDFESQELIAEFDANPELMEQWTMVNNMSIDWRKNTKRLGKQLLVNLLGALQTISFAEKEAGVKQEIALETLSPQAAVAKRWIDLGGCLF